MEKRTTAQETPGKIVSVYLVNLHLEGLDKLRAIRQAQLPEHDPVTGMRPKAVSISSLIQEFIHTGLRAEGIIE